MDKPQKELIKSYFRARNIAVSDNHSIGYQPYELSIEGVKNDWINLNLLDSRSYDEEFFMDDVVRHDIAMTINKMDYDKLRREIQLSTIIKELKNNPEKIKEINWEKIKNNEKFPYDIVYIAAEIPEYFSDDFFNSLDGELVTILLNDNPELINKVKYNKIGPHNAANLIAKNPDLFKYLKIFIPDMDIHDITILLGVIPELQKYVMKHNKNYANQINYYSKPENKIKTK